MPMKIKLKLMLEARNKGQVVILLMLIPILIVATVASQLIMHRNIPQIISVNLNNVPKTINDYNSTEGKFTESVYDALNADITVYRHYIKGNKPTINLYIGYYGTVKGGRTWHRPKECLPAVGWKIIHQKKIQITVNTNKKYEIFETLAYKGNIYQLLYHWHQSNRNKVITDDFYLNIDRFISRLRYNKNDGAYVQVSTFMLKDNIENAKANTRDFTRSVLAYLPEYWPEEK